jgi:hypothetical protein
VVGSENPFYRQLNQLLREHGTSAGFCAETMGRPGLPPGIYFQLLLIGYFEGIDSERGIDTIARSGITTSRQSLFGAR